MKMPNVEAMATLGLRRAARGETAHGSLGFVLRCLGSRLRRRTRSAHVFKREGCLYQGVRGCTLGVSKRRILSFGRSPVLEL